MGPCAQFWHRSWNKKSAARVNEPVMSDKRLRFETTVMPHLDAAFGYARRLARSAADAEDLLQDAVLRAFRGFEGLQGSNAKAWLLTIVRNCHATAWQRRERRAAIPLPEDDDLQHPEEMAALTPDPERASIDQEQERVLMQLIASLSEEHRVVLLLREIEELSYREIAVATDLPIGTVMSRLARARDALRAQWIRQNQGALRVVP
jgi:RNA polymerase sigma factor (sigma-70 family)